VTVKVEQSEVQYKLVQNADQIIENVHNQNVETISIIITIEGSHVFNSFANRRAEKKEILANVEDLKSWKYKPLYISPRYAVMPEAFQAYWNRYLIRLMA
jgi:hypothetical protein